MCSMGPGVSLTPSVNALGFSGLVWQSIMHNAAEKAGVTFTATGKIDVGVS